VRSGLKTIPFMAGKDDEFQALQKMMTSWAG
jgi:hypothetical protein